jgi:hypothetical protein
MFVEPWKNRPAELLGFARWMSDSDSDAARIAAFLATDQSVEIMLKNECQSGPARDPGGFHDFLDRVRRDKPDALRGIDPAVVKECHKVRNKLQHDYQFAVRRTDLRSYMDIAAQLFKNLYDADLPKYEEDTRESAISSFNQTWGAIQDEMRIMRARCGRKFGPQDAMLEDDHLVQKLYDMGGCLSRVAATCFPLVRAFKYRLDRDPNDPPLRSEIHRHCALAELVLEELRDVYLGP